MANAADGIGADDILQQIRVAADLAEQAGHVALRWFRAPVDVLNKAGEDAFDPVTRADKETEAFLRAELSKRFPEHALLGEEEGEGGGSGPLRWVIDPIDGTRAFVTGNPLWGVMIGLDSAAGALGGVVHIPFTGETYFAAGGRAWLRHGGRERGIRAGGRPLEESVLYSTHPDMFGDGATRASFDRLAARCRLIRWGGDCYSYCQLALGQVDFVVEAMLQPYDIIPVAAIVRGAGGVVTNWDGGPAEPGGKIIAAANADLHRVGMAALAGRLSAAGS